MKVVVYNGRGKYLKKPIKMEWLSHCLQHYIKMKFMTHALSPFSEAAAHH